MTPVCIEDKPYIKHYAIKEKTNDPRIDTPLMDDRIRKAIDHNLMAKGFVKISADNNPDFLVAYTYSISRKIYSSPVNTSFGYGYGPYGRYGAIGFGTGTQIDEYDEGLLMIDIFTQSTNHVIWQGRSTHVFNTHSTPEKSDDQINQIVKKTISQFPPGKAN